MTSKEIAYAALKEIYSTCDTALGYWSWQAKAEYIMNDMLHMARDNNKSCTAVVKEVMKATGTGRTNELLGMAAGTVLSDWNYYGWLKAAESREYKKLIAD